MNIQEMLHERGQVVHELKALQKKVETEKKGVWSDEDNAQFENLFNKSQDLKNGMDKARQVQDLTADLESLANDPHRPILSIEEGKVRSKTGKEAQVLDAFGRYLLHNHKGLIAPAHRQFTAEHQAILKNALSQGVSSEGGYLSPPQEFVAQLIRMIDDQVFIRSKATTHQLTVSDSMGFPSLDADPADADWTSEIAQIQEDSTMAFGKRELKPYKLSKRIKVSNMLLQSASISPEQLVMERLAYKFAITEEKAYLTGTGASQPLGLFTASNDGISTSRDVAGSNTSTAIVADTLLDVKYKLKSQYWNRSEWLYHRDAMKMIAKLKDANNQYLFRESARAGEPDTLVGRPIMMSEYGPNTFTTGLYVGLLGDFSFYWIIDSLMMSFKRLDELYAENDQTGFIARKMTDGAPVLEEAFVRMKLG